jgi:ABC-type transport system involved in cytochrome bd biosynthesis fused ATPase/permease subunit
MSVADVRVAWVEVCGLIASKVFIVEGMAKQTIFSSAELLCLEAVASRKGFSMQNCFVENLKRMTNFYERFISSLVYRILYSLLIKQG